MIRDRRYDRECREDKSEKNNQKRERERENESMKFREEKKPESGEI